MAGPEAKIERAVTKWWRDMGYESIKQKKRGWPDQLFIGPRGLHVHIEFKAPGGRVSPLQKHTIRQLTALQCKVHVCNNIDQTKEILNAELDSTQVPT